MKRYQNPNIFEHLAMSYALGTLQGKARLRFEKLMGKHLYLRAVTNAYQQQFAPLANLIPSKTPPARVWNAISQELQLSKRSTTASAHWLTKLKDYLPWSMAAFGSVAASAMTVLLLNTQPAAYMAALKPPIQQDKMMLVTVYHDTMEIAFDMPSGALPAKGDMMPTVWCILKDSDKPPMRMGTLTAHGENRMPIDKATWKEMANVSQFAISLEPMDKPPSDTPQGEVVFSGDLAAL
jgi:anti-sigma-K factor RskA